MKEVNEVLQKVYGGEKVVPLWHGGTEDEEPSTSQLRRILFSLVIRIQVIMTYFELFWDWLCGRIGVCSIC